MRALIVILSVFAFTLNAVTVSADDNTTTENGDKYCAKMKDGMLKVIHEGTFITSDVTLGDGTIIKTDATVVKKDGSKISLKEGECIGKDGVAPVKDPKQQK